MSEQQAQYEATDGLRERVKEHLEELIHRPRQGHDHLQPLKDLFRTELNYDLENDKLSRRDWRPQTASYLAEDPLLLASGAGGDFPIIYARLRDNQLLVGQERPIVMELLKKQLNGLFVFSNTTQSKWHFVNVKEESKNTLHPLIRRMTVGPDERLCTAIDRLSMLDLSRMSHTSRLDIVELHERAFDVGALTKAFFNAYRLLFREFQADFTGQTGDEKWAHDYALQFLNRCMFLYFIQCKGWLGGNREFLRTFWQAYLSSEHGSDRFYEHWLSVLFLQAFNRGFDGSTTWFPPAIYEALAYAPYLNGGLFAQNELDTRHSFRISDYRFSKAFDFFESYNFTIAEHSPLDQEVAVDPEMIGYVYESLVNVSTEANERNDAGIFYTPRAEIDLMCRLSLVEYLTNRIGMESKNVLYDVVFALEPHEKSEADDWARQAAIWDAIGDGLRRIRCLDPACGSGSFLVGMLYVLDDLNARVNRGTYDAEDIYKRKKRVIEESLYGVDVMAWAVQTAELRLLLSLIIDTDMSTDELHNRKDPLLPHLSFKIRCGDSLVHEHNRGFDIVIGNPPYVRQERIGATAGAVAPGGGSYKSKLAESVYQTFPDFFLYEEGGTAGRKIDAKSDLYIYFYFQGLSLLKPQGVLCFITSNSWLDVGYGADLQEFLLRYCYIKLILDNQSKRSFVSADVNTIITLFSAPAQGPSEAVMEHIARFVSFKVDFEQVLNAALFTQIEQVNERRTMPEYRVHPIGQRDLLEEGYVQKEAAPEKEEEPTKKPGRRQKKATASVMPGVVEMPVYGGNKWGGKYLRAPDIYWTILKKGRDKLVRLDNVAEIRYGIKTGINQFFYLDELKVRQWHIEDEFLRPVITKANECKTIFIDPDSLKKILFVCHKSKKEIEGTAALAYIEWGESQSFNKNTSVTNRARWWDLGHQNPFDFVVLQFRDKRIWSPINITPSLLASNIVFVGTWRDRSNVMICNALLNSTVMVLVSEVYGRVNLGDGLLTTYGPEILSFDFLKPTIFNDSERESLTSAFNELGKRDVMSIFDEVRQSDRHMLDTVVFDALGLTQREREAVYEAVIELVESRLNKAKSLKETRELNKRR